LISLFTMSNRYLLLPLFVLVLFAAAFAQAAGDPLVSATQLRSSLDEYLLLDIRTTKEYNQGHIPGALNADYFAKGWAKTRNGVPNLAPPPDLLADIAGVFGIEPETRVVVVSASGSANDIGGAARVVWLLTYLGHDQVAMLDGGIRAWRDAGGELVKEHTLAESTFPYPLDNLRPHLLAGTNDIALIDFPIDARTDEYHYGWQKHPNARVAGSLEGSKRLVHASLLDEKTLKFASRDKVRKLVAESGINTQDPMVVYCNSGWWASTTWLALYFLADHKQASLYDGSMIEWTLDKQRPVVDTKSRIDHLWRELKNLVGLDERNDLMS